MAILHIRLNDETLDTYAERFPEDVAAGVEATLERFKAIPPSERALLFSPEGRVELEKLFGGPIENEKDLIEHVKRLSSFKLQNLKFTLNARQVARAASNAKFFGKDINEELKRVVEQAKLAAFGQ